MRLKFRYLISGLLVSFLISPASGAEDAVKSAMVKIYTVYNRPNYHEPWQMHGQLSYHGSGCIIEGNRILTNAHVVSDQTFIQVRRAGKAKKFTAILERVAHECDLAILKVEDEAFFSGAVPLAIGDLPNLRDRVAVYGFPEGGDKLSITEGVVSRVEHGKYAHSSAYLLTCQVDASINSGNSGGPVIKDNRIVGVAFQGLAAGEYENIGYMVPAPTIKRFLNDIQDGRYDGTPDLGISMQKLENPDMRRMYHLAPEDTGILVNRIYPDSPAQGLLETGDVILSIDGERVGSDGTIEFRPGERTFFGYLMQNKHIGDTVDLKIQRGQSIRLVKIKLSQTIDYERLVPHELYDTAPTYYIVGGLVFSPLSLNYLMEYGGGVDWYLAAPEQLLNYYNNGEPTEDRRQVIVLVKVLPGEINIGYHGFEDWVIDTVNGKKLSDMQDLVAAIENNRGAYHVITNTLGFQIVLDRRKTNMEGPEILQRYKIRADRSEDLMAAKMKKKLPPAGPGRPRN
jgi:S1-C subfamily serine protease